MKKGHKGLFLQKTDSLVFDLDLLLCRMNLTISDDSKDEAGGGEKEEWLSIHRIGC